MTQGSMDEGNTTGRVQAIFEEKRKSEGITQDFLSLCDKTLAQIDGRRHQVVSNRPRGARRMLIVEDDPTLLKSMHRTLTDPDLPRIVDYVDLAPTADEAIIKSAEDNYGVIVLDYLLDSGTALDLYQRVCDQQPDALVILVSGVLATAQIRLAAEYINAYAWHEKPLGRDELRAAVERAFDARARRAAEVAAR